MDQTGFILQRARRHSPAARAATAVIAMLFAIKGQTLPLIVGAVVDATLFRPIRLSADAVESP